jgi:hypothetical protein
MKSFAFAALSLAAAPLHAQENPRPPSGQTDAFLMPCPEEETLDQCVDNAKQVSKEINAPVLTIKTSPSGTPTIRFILRDAVYPVDPKDIEVEMYYLPEEAPGPMPTARPAPPDPTA